MKKKFLAKNLSITVCAFLLSQSAALAEQNNTNELESITVIGSESDYTTEAKPTILRGNIDLEDTAKSVQIFNRNFINDFQIKDIVEVLTMSSNVIFFGDNNGRASTYAIRGFMNVPLLRDGMNINNAIGNPEVYGLERVEVLKGPASLQYGQGGAGGLINLVKKKPDSKETQGELVLEATSEGKYSTKFDIQGAANEEGSARYRVVSSYLKDGNDNTNFNTDTTKIYIAPSLAYDINDNNTLTLVAEYFDVERPTDYGKMIDNNGELIGDREDITSHPDDKMTTEQKVFGFDLESNFGDWESNLRYRYSNYLLDIGDTYLPYSYVSKTDTLYRYYSYMKQENKENLLQYTIDKEYDVSGIKHKISMGIDYSKLNQNYTNTYDTTPLYYIDFSDQKFESAMTSASDHTDAVDFGGTGNDIDKAGVFIQDSIELSSKVITQLGLRAEKYDVSGDNGTPDGVVESKKYNSTTPNIGFVYKYSPKTSLYANYSESFHMQDIRYTDENNKLLDPEEGKGFEIGIKQKLFKDHFNLTAALFQIDKENVAMYNATTAKYLPSDTQKSKGFELDLSGEIAPGWSMVASYGYADTEVTYAVTTRGVGTTYYNGKELVGVAKHSGNLFSTYYINENLYFGAGARYIGKRYVDYVNTVEVDSSVIYNAMMGYTTKDWSAKFAVKNLSDETYFEAVGANGLGSTTRNNELGDPRTFIATLTYKF